MISEAPGIFSPLEVARNRLAKALFFLCITIVVLAITVNRSADEFYATEKKLSDRVSELTSVRNRLLTFVDPDAAYFADRLQAAFDVICLTPLEATALNFKYGNGLKFLFSNKEDLVNKGALIPKCRSGFVTAKVDREAIFAIAENLKKLILEKQQPPHTAIEKIETLNFDKNRELWGLLLAYWGTSDLAKLISHHWLDWRSMRNWVLTDFPPYWLSPAKADRSTDYIVGGSYSTYDTGTVSGLGNLYQRFDKLTYAISTTPQDLGVIAAAVDGRYAITELEKRLKDATQELKIHSPELKWSAVGFGGISISVLQWLEWMPWLVVALLALFVSFDQRASSTEGVSTSKFWFPRLGRPRDPLSPPLPVGDRWGPAVFWFCFLTLPAAVCYWGAVMRFQILDWSSIGILVSRGFFAHPADWFNSVAFIACLGLTIQSTSSQDEYEGRNLRVLKLVVWVCFVAAACAALIVAIDQLFVRTDYQGNPSSALWDGQVYLIFLSFAIAWIAIGSMKNLSRFGAFTLFSLAIANYVLVVRTTLA